MVSCFYLYLEWQGTFLLGYLLAVLDFLFFAQFVLPFLPLIFVEVNNNNNNNNGYFLSAISPESS